jgi:thiamine biosynthesis protein ThiS
MAVTERMAVTVNGEERSFAPGLSVQGLLEELGLHPRLVVVERNREIVERASYPAVEVRPGDTLELVHFVGGG